MKKTFADYTLKNGRTIKLCNGTWFTVRGKVAYSHFTTPLSTSQIERYNSSRFEKGSEAVTPYGLLILDHVSVCSKGVSPNNCECFIADKLFESSKYSGGKRIALKNHIGKIATGMLDENSGNVSKFEFDDEPALGTDVVARGRIYISRYGSIGMELLQVLTVGEPSYQHDKEAAS